MADMFADQIPVEEKVAHLRREVGMRRSVYARRVAENKMSAHAAERGIAVMVAILADYEEGRKP